MRFYPKRDGDWQEWFAWHPVETYGSVWVWLERVDRKRTDYYGGPYCTYRLPRYEG